MLGGVWGLCERFDNFGDFEEGHIVAVDEEWNDIRSGGAVVDESGGVQGLGPESTVVAKWGDFQLR